MTQLTLIALGSLKESYWREALAEYEKRLQPLCKTQIVTLKEAPLPDSPSAAEIRAALREEGERVLAAIPPRAYKIALCVEGKQFSSEELAKKLDTALGQYGQVCLVIGSSHGLSDEVKQAADLRLSVSALTFPHQMMRVMLLEILYRCFGILKGTKYHK